MTVTVKFFASLREKVGTGSVQLNASTPLTVAQAWSQASDEIPLPSHVLMAVNMEYVEPTTVLHDGDEVAFFPPVTGG